MTGQTISTTDAGHQHNRAGVRRLGQAVALTVGLAAATGPAMAELSYGEELNAQRQQCLNSGGSWSGNNCSYQQRGYSDSDGGGGGGLLGALTLIVIGAVACAATDCLDQKEGE